MMTKKDFIALADTIRSSKPVCLGLNSECRQAVLEHTIHRTQWWRDVDALADFCASQNPRFDRWRWLDYITDECGPSGGKL